MWSLEFVEVADESFLKSMQKSVNRAFSQCDSVDKTQNNSTKKHTHSADLASSMLAEFKDPEHLVAKQKIDRDSATGDSLREKYGYADISALSKADDNVYTRGRCLSTSISNSYNKLLRSDCTIIYKTSFQN